VNGHVSGFQQLCGLGDVCVLPLVTEIIISPRDGTLIYLAFYLLYVDKMSFLMSCFTTYELVTLYFFAVIALLFEKGPLAHFK
jgi:hypothetical protein